MGGLYFFQKGVNVKIESKQPILTEDDMFLDILYFLGALLCAALGGMFFGLSVRILGMNSVQRRTWEENRNILSRMRKLNKKLRNGDRLTPEESLWLERHTERGSIANNGTAITPSGESVPQYSEGEEVYRFWHSVFVRRARGL